MLALGISVKRICFFVINYIRYLLPMLNTLFYSQRQMRLGYYVQRLVKQQTSLDLHVLGTPPAFVLSQDQTLVLYILLLKLSLSFYFFVQIYFFP